MPHFILTTGSASLFGVIIGFYLYFAPAIVAFIRGHRRFWIVLGLNLAVAPVQLSLSQHFGLFLHPGMETGDLVGVVLLAVLGPGWLLLLAWALLPQADPDPRLKAWRESKTYDMAAALPLMVWFLNSAMTMQPDATFLGKLILAGSADTLMLLHFASLVVSALFCLACAWFLLIRDTPVLRVQGLWPRLAALCGTFLAVAMPHLEVPEMNLLRQEAVYCLTGLGAAAAILVLFWLGKSFAIMPEARTLVTSGPYRHVRHPLYAAQMVTVFGMILQYRQPWSLLLGGAVIALQVGRSFYEEQVLRRAFPEYEAYSARTKRFIPGVI